MKKTTLFLFSFALFFIVPGSSCAMWWWGSQDTREEEKRVQKENLLALLPLQGLEEIYRLALEGQFVLQTMHKMMLDERRDSLLPSGQNVLKKYQDLNLFVSTNKTISSKLGNVWFKYMSEDDLFSILPRFINAGADINRHIWFGKPISTTSANGKKVTKNKVEYVAQPTSSLNIAINFHQNKLLRYLLANGANINEVNCWNLHGRENCALPPAVPHFFPLELVLNDPRNKDLFRYFLSYITIDSIFLKRYYAYLAEDSELFNLVIASCIFKKAKAGGKKFEEIKDCIVSLIIDLPIDQQPDFIALLARSIDQLEIYFKTMNEYLWQCYKILQSAMDSFAKNKDFDPQGITISNEYYFGFDHREATRLFAWLFEITELAIAPANVQNLVLLYANFLLTQGAYVDIYLDSASYTALHKAILANNTQFVRFLLEHGASAHMTSSEGVYPLQMIKNKNREILQLLLKSGADTLMPKQIVSTGALLFGFTGDGKEPYLLENPDDNPMAAFKDNPAMMLMFFKHVLEGLQWKEKGDKSLDTVVGLLNKSDCKNDEIIKSIKATIKKFVKIKWMLMLKEFLVPRVIVKDTRSIADRILLRSSESTLQKVEPLERNLLAYLAEFLAQNSVKTFSLS
jgi:ankyrin repeat protein